MLKSERLAYPEFKNSLVPPPVTPAVKKLLGLFFKYDSLENQQIRELLNLKDRKSIREYYNGPALEIGVTEYVIPGKPNSRLQKYHLGLFPRWS